MFSASNWHFRLKLGQKDMKPAFAEGKKTVENWLPGRVGKFTLQPLEWAKEKQRNNGLLLPRPMLHVAYLIAQILPCSYHLLLPTNAVRKCVMCIKLTLYWVIKTADSTQVILVLRITIIIPWHSSTHSASRSAHASAPADHVLVEIQAIMQQL